MMTEYLNQIFHTGNRYLNEFNQGYVAAIVVILLVLLVILVLRLILRIIFHRKSCQGITVKQEKGDVFISRSAIDTVVKSLKKDFKHIKIMKVSVCSAARSCQHIRIYLDFDNSGGGLPPQSAQLQNQVIKALKDIFGISSVKKVHITLRDITVADKMPEPEAAKEPVPEKRNEADSGVSV